MLCQPIFRRVCSVALITIKPQILHSQSENRNLRNNDSLAPFPPGALVAPVNWLKRAGIRKRYFPHLSHLIHFLIPVLVQILKSLAASPLTTTATFSTIHFSMSEAEYSSLVASSASSAQLVIEISTDLIQFTFFCIFCRFSFPPWHRISFIDIHCFFSCVTNIISCSRRNNPLPPPEPAGLLYWGWLTSIPLKCFPHLPQSQRMFPHYVFILVS